MRISIAMTTALFLLTSASALADADYSMSNLGKGGYYAADLGFNNLSIDYSNRGVYSKKGSKSTATVGALLGIGETTGNWYIGAEAGLQYSKASVDLTHGTIKDTIDVKNYLALDLLPGYFFSNNFLGYARIGYSLGRLEFKQSQNGTPQYSNGTDLNSIRLGFGATTPLSKDWAIGADFVHTFAPAYTFSEANKTQNFSIKPSSNALTLRVQYSMS